MQTGDREVIVDVEWIAARVGDPQVRLLEVDVSRTAYDEGHIPGAVLWNAYTDLRGQDYRPVADAELGSLLSRSAVLPDATVVVYGYGAPLGFWLLKASGHQDVRMLTGSRDQWTAAGHQWTVAVPEPVESVEMPFDENAAVIASRRLVEAAIDDPRQVLLDVRAESEYNGERFWPSGATEDVGRAGHIPGAINIPIGLLRKEDGTVKSTEELRRIFERAGVSNDKAVIVYCTIGNRASEAWFALKYLLHHPDARVYYGSWVEWGKATDTPVET
jgi:thiosulfate/3-mercaptopyruvate sulfurtransferase